MSFAEIGDTTPIELDELVQQYHIRMDIENTRFGVICSVMANLKRDEKKKSQPYLPTDFFPQQSKRKQPTEEVTEKQAAAVLDDFWFQVRARSKPKNK